MKKFILAASALSLSLLCSCGIFKDKKAEDVPFETVSEEAAETTKPTTTEAVTEAEAGKEETAEPDAEYSGEYREEYDDEGISAEESMRIEEKKRTIKPDENGFIIENNILYDYVGVLPKVEIPDGVTCIEKNAFWSNDVVEALYIPSSVKEIGNSAFWSCSNLKFIQAEEGLETIHSCAFWSCSGLENVNLPKSVTLIGDSTFWAVPDITIHAPNGSYAIKFAQNHGFGYDSSYAEYSMTDRKNVIRGGQYTGSDITEFTTPENITAIEAESFNYSALESLVVTSNVEYIGQNAFEYCDKLKTAELHCHEIKAEAFEYCESVETVIIGSECEKIGSSAFAYCEKLADVWLTENVAYIDNRSFEYCAPNLTLHVPTGSYAEEYAISNNIPFDNAIY